MDSDKIRRYLTKRCGEFFIGVYSEDTLPSKAKKPFVLVCNTDAKNLPGEHWIAIYIGEDDRGEFFDSFGREPGEPFSSFLNKHLKYWIYNDKHLQSITSSFCGHYCCFYCFYRSKGFDLISIINMFGTNVLVNDSLVHKFVCM